MHPPPRVVSGNNVSQEHAADRSPSAPPLGGSAMGDQSHLGRIGLGAAVLYLLGLWFDSGLLQLLSKCVPVVCMALWVGAFSAGPYAGLLKSGLYLSALGDFFLVFGDKPAFFVLGLLSFLGAHLLYCGAFANRAKRLSPLAGLLAYGFGLSMFLYLQPGLGGMTLPVLAYVLVISTMLWRALAATGANGPSTTEELAGAVGAVFFTLSDSLLALNKFHAPLAGAAYSVILTYWIGQFLIARSARLS